MAGQKFGGDWTEDKLGRVSEYLGRYNTALKNQSFTREYIDASFGMQVSWETLEAVAGTKCIDAWILLPLCVAITRLLKRDGNIDESVCRRLDVVFGERTWRDAFYKPVVSVAPKAQSWLFRDDDTEPETHWKVDLSLVELHFIDRLRGIFAGVAPNPVRLRNSKNVPLYLLFIVAGNEKGVPIAVKIVESIMSSP